jgi:hypothetical protein
MKLKKQLLLSIVFLVLGWLLLISSDSWDQPVLCISQGYKLQVIQMIVIPLSLPCAIDWMSALVQVSLSIVYVDAGGRMFSFPTSNCTQNVL